MLYRYEEPTATRKCDEIASMASETDYHIYEELLPKNEYENTRVGAGYFF